MLDFGFYNMDCIQGMKAFPDKYFDLAIVDPVYGDVTKGGYMTHNVGQRIGTGKANQKGYHNGLWNQAKTGKDYFDELFRVSKNQIIWGGITLRKICHNRKVGLYGIRCILKELDLQIASWHGLLLTKPQGYLDLCGTVCYKVT